MEDLDIENDDGIRLELSVMEDGSLWIATDGDFELTLDQARELRDRISFFIGDE